jgi:hypothetical protein
MGKLTIFMAIFNSYFDIVDFPIFSPLIPEAWYLQPLRRGGQVLVQALNLKTSPRHSGRWEKIESSPGKNMVIHRDFS